MSCNKKLAEQHMGTTVHTLNHVRSFAKGGLKKWMHAPELLLMIHIFVRFELLKQRQRKFYLVQKSNFYSLFTCI